MVFEHDTDDDIEAEKLKSLEEIDFLIKYELFGSFWHELVPTQWMRDIMSWYIQKKVMRKWKRYKFIKMLGDVQTQTQEITRE